MKKIIVLLIPFFMLSIVLVKGGEPENKIDNANNLNQEKMRIRIKEVEPKVYGIMNEFEKYLKEIDLSETHKELIKIRASQLNNCGYCLNLHSKDALKAGESESRIYMLPLWKTVPQFYTEEEQVVLQMTEEITFIQNGLSDATYNRAISLLSEKYVAQVITAIIAINAWNRIGVSTQMEEECSL
jgi:AhpD family alkylhydroperoxidase